jgi:hypothetical protein
LQNIKSIFLLILDFDNKTLFFQTILVFGLIAIFGINFGFNEMLLSWLRKVLSHIFDTNDLKKFALKYFITLTLSSLILIKGIFACIAIVKYNATR